MRSKVNGFELAWCLAAVLVATVALLIMGTGCSSIPTGATEGYLITCGSLESIPEYNYCVAFRQNNEEIKKTVFYLPGLGDDSSVFKSSLFDQSSLKKLMQETHHAIFVSFSIGKTGLITHMPDRILSPRKATVENVNVKVLNELATKFPLPRPYILTGHSRGSEDALILALSNPEKFDALILFHPMINCKNIFDFLDLKCYSSVVYRGNYTMSEWKAHSPDILLSRATKLPPTLVTACATDSFYLYEPAKDFVARATLLGLPIVYEEGNSSCTHNKYNTDAAVRMIASFPVVVP